MRIEWKHEATERCTEPGEGCGRAGLGTAASHYESRGYLARQGREKRASPIDIEGTGAEKVGNPGEVQAKRGGRDG